MTGLILTFGLCLLGFTLVGALSVRHAKGTTADYLLAGRSVSPWLTALSSVATNNSGFMFIGLIGYAFTSGIEAIWLQASWIVGDLLAWLFVHGRVRALAGELDVLSVPAFLGSHRAAKSIPEQSGGRLRTERLTVVLAGLLTLFLLAGYAAAQIKAGSTTLEVLFGWPPAIGALIGAGIVLLYCWSGGIRASIWTDAAQSFVMILAMALLMLYAGAKVGGPSELLARLGQEDPRLADLTPHFPWGPVPYVLGFLAGGLAAVGQPHILIRTMALRKKEEISATRWFYFAWFIPFSCFSLAVGLYSRVLLPDLLSRTGPLGLALSAEHALPALSLELLPQALVGLILAGLFSATLSTADSQILACSAAVTQDVFPSLRKSTRVAKATTVTVTALALGLALSAQKGVFQLVLMSWALLGATLGPLVLLRIMGIVPRGSVAAVMMLSGGLVVIFGRSYSGAMYEVLPGMVVPLLVYAFARFLGGRLRGRRVPAQEAPAREVPEGAASERAQLGCHSGQ